MAAFEPASTAAIIPALASSNLVVLVSMRTPASALTSESVDARAPMAWSWATCAAFGHLSGWLAPMPTT